MPAQPPDSSPPPRDARGPLRRGRQAPLAGLTKGEIRRVEPIVQISLDLTSKEEALETAALAMRAGVDWLEAGTPLILAEGLHGVRALRQAFPGVPIVA